MKIETYEQALKAVKNDGENIQFVPQHIRTPDLCLIAVKNHGWVLQFVPEDIKQGNIKTDINDLNSLKAYVRFTPEEKQTKEYIEAIITKASTQDIDELGDFISLKAIPGDFIPCLINISNDRLKDFVKRSLVFSDNKK